MRTLIVTNKKDIYLVDYLKKIFPSLKTSVIFKALRNKDIKVNDKRINTNIMLTQNDKLDIYINDTLLFNIPKEIKVIYEDENILVVFKPQGILSNIELENKKENSNSYLEPTLEDLVKNTYPFAKICHRLDRNTSGLVMFSKNDISYLELLNGFKNGYILKEYKAYVSNSNFVSKHEILEKYIKIDKLSGYSKIYNNFVKGSYKISTEYFVEYIDKKLDYAILRVIIHTGKTHQIRAQLKSISHPIIGDPKYGKNEINKKFKIYKQLLFATHYSFSFPTYSPLFYLNTINISLDNKYYNKNLGSD